MLRYSQWFDAGQPGTAPDLKGFQCDDAGSCTRCQPVRILSLGQRQRNASNSGSTDNTDAFQAFMNSNTKGTATMQMLKTFTHITDLDLSQYDVIILQGTLHQTHTTPMDCGRTTLADAAALYELGEQQEACALSRCSG